MLILMDSLLNENDRLADFEVHINSLSDTKTLNYPNCLEVQTENHSSSENNLK